MSSSELLDLNRAALVLIDVQQEYFAEGGPLRIPDGPMVLAKLRSLLEDYREANMPIVHIRHEEAPGAPVFALDGPLVESMPDVAPRGTSSRSSSSTRPARSRTPSCVRCSASWPCAVS